MLCAVLVTSTYLYICLGSRDPCALRFIPCRQLIRGITKRDFYRKRRNPYIIVNRNIFDERLVRRFKNAGGNIKEEERNYKINYDAKMIIMEDGSILRYRYLVGADGVYSVTRKYVDPSYIIPDGICLQTYHSDKIDIVSPLSIHLYYGLLDVGYGWLFPREDGFLTGAISQVRHGDIKEAYAAICKRKNMVWTNMEKTQAHPWCNVKTTYSHTSK